MTTKNNISELSYYYFSPNGAKNPEGIKYLLVE
jgi:hypothetical protein